MKLVALLACVVIGSACGGVNEADGDGDGDGDTCNGTEDGDGNCICDPRFTAPPACESCALGWSGAACSTFGDDFGRAAGDLGAAYMTPNLGVAEAAVIVNSRACGDVQSIAALTERIGSRNISASLTFDPGGIDGQEMSFIVSDDLELAGANGLFIAGCDGGGGECILRIGEVNQQPLAESDTPITLQAGMMHTVDFFVDGSENIDIMINGDAATRLNAKLPAGFTVERFGFIVGREPDGALSCVDDLSVVVE
jgi:hypothetical protein